MTRIFKPSWFNAPQETPISVGQERRAGTRSLRLPKAPGPAGASEEALPADGRAIEPPLTPTPVPYLGLAEPPLQAQPTSSA
jgi:hypothetical protein